MPNTNIHAQYNQPQCLHVVQDNQYVFVMNLYAALEMHLKCFDRTSFDLTWLTDDRMKLFWGLFLIDSLNLMTSIIVLLPHHRRNQLMLQTVEKKGLDNTGSFIGRSGLCVLCGNIWQQYESTCNALIKKWECKERFTGCYHRSTAL